MIEEKLNRKVDETLNSINNIIRAVPDDRLFYKIENRFKNTDNVKTKDYSYTGKFALAFAILIIINIFSFIGYKNHHSGNEIKTTQNVQNTSKIINEFAKEYFFDTNEYYNYK